jgi:uncharacterized damage-inducible protein DinB
MTMSNSSVAAAIQANLAVIRQGVDLLQELGDERYAARVAIVHGASVGGHMRHIIEHYLSFLNGWADGAVNYEDRARDPSLERDAALAGETLSAIDDRLRELAREGGDRRLRVHAETSADTAADSSGLRELEFLLSHTIHHYALVAVLARMQGVEPAGGFGVAPSTLKHQERLACAR